MKAIVTVQLATRTVTNGTTVRQAMTQGTTTTFREEGRRAGVMLHTRGWLQGLYSGCIKLLLCFDPSTAGVWIRVSFELREDGNDHWQ